MHEKFNKRSMVHRELGFVFIGTIAASTCMVGIQLHGFFSCY